MRKVQKQTDHDFEVFEDNWESLIFFIELDTQWNIVSGMNGERVTGLHYPSVESAMNIQQIPQENRQELFRDLKVMERSALEVINKAKG